jgi:hypothetical protein
MAKIEFVHNPHRPSWVRFQPEGGWANFNARVDMGPNRGLALEMIEGHRGNGRDVRRQTLMQITNAEACALRDFLVEHFPKEV